MNHESVWSEALGSVEELQELRRAHRSDGVLTAAEDAAETAFIRSRVMACVGNAAEVQDICQAVARSGPEGYRARELMRQRRQRLADAARFAPTDPDDGGPAALRGAA